MAVRTFFFFALILLFFACGETERIKVRDEQGNIIEDYWRNKTDFGKQGLYVAFYPEGGKEEEANYVRDTLDGERKIYYPNGQVQIIEHYQMGLFQGVYQAFYESGKLELEGNYVDNVMMGSWKRYYENGQLLEDVQFENNEENGPFIEYHENGKLKTKGAYKDGDHEHGLLEMYDTTGLLERKMNCDMGVCHTIWLRDTTEVQK